MKNPKRVCVMPTFSQILVLSTLRISSFPLNTREEHTGDQNICICFRRTHAEIEEFLDGSCFRYDFARNSPLPKEGDVGIFGFADLAKFWFGCSLFGLKSCGFRDRFWWRFADFLQFSLWLSVFVNNDGSFSDCSAQCNLQHFSSSFAKEVIPRSRAKTSNSKGPLIVKEGVN